MQYISSKKDRGRFDFFLMVSLAVLALNFFSQAMAFPVQCLLLIYSVVKSDIRLFPGMFLLMLDKSNFPSLEGVAIKVHIGFALSPQNVFLIACFAVCLSGLFRRWYDNRTSIWILFWLLCIIPALAMALPAKREGLAAVWQNPIVQFLTPSLYFWGIGVAKTWDKGQDYFVSRMILILTVVNVLSFFNEFYIFTFAEHITMISLFVGAVIMRVGSAARIIGAIGALFALANVLFARYMRLEKEVGFAGEAEVGSTFTRVMVVIIGVSLIAYFASKHKNAGVVRKIPYVALIICSIVLFYAVGRARSSSMSDTVSKEYQNIFERFEYKLVGDRGSVWNAGMEEVFRAPYFIKNLKDQMDMVYDYQTGMFVLGIRLLPHNQVLTLLGRSGWWEGLFMILFLWWTHTKAFNAAADMLWDKTLLCVLLSTSAAVFIAVGLTGQTVLSHLFCSNGLVTMVFPGMIYGVWRNRRMIYRGR